MSAAGRSGGVVWRFGECYRRIVGQRRAWTSVASLATPSRCGVATCGYVHGSAFGGEACHAIANARIVRGNDLQTARFRSSSAVTHPSADDEIIFYALRSPTPITLKSMKEHGREPTPTMLLMSAEFLRTELAVRLAHR